LTTLINENRIDTRPYPSVSLIFGLNQHVFKCGFRHTNNEIRFLESVEKYDLL